MDDHLPRLEIEPLLYVMTFLAVEKRIASGLRDRVQATAHAINADEVRAIATRRQAGYWASLAGATSSAVPRHALHEVYNALVAAADFYALRNLHKNGFDYPDATAMYRAYKSEIYWHQHSDTKSLTRPKWSGTVDSARMVTIASSGATEGPHP